MDLAPCYFDSVHILKHAGCNVAYWNLHERTIESQDGHYRVGDVPLVFFHFSGVDASKPQTLSRHQNRHSLVPGSALARLVSDYCECLLAAGHQRWSGVPYSFGRLDDGTPITPLMRRAASLSSFDCADPFNPASDLQLALRKAGLRHRGAQDAGKATTLNFDAGDRRVLLVNWLIRLAARIAGAETVTTLLRYATFLSWQSNAAAVLLDKPFDLEHRDRR